MTESEFHKWCIWKEPKLKRYRVAEIIEVYGFMVTIFSWFGAIFLIEYFAQKFFNLDIEGIILLLGGLALIIPIAFFMVRFGGFPMNRIEYISCLLNKIAQEIELYKTSRDKRELEYDIKALEKSTIYTSNFPSRHLFKGDINKQEKFYNLLERLPSRLLYKLEKGLIREIKHEDIKNLGYQIYIDSEEKVDILEKITKDSPDMSKPKPNLISRIVSKILAGKFSKLSLVTLFLIGIFYFLVFGFLGIGKDTAAIGCITLIAVAAYIIFKK